MMILVDCNNFFVSCERLFNPRLEKKPLIILSNNDGCVVSRSEEAKRLGIAMGAPFFKVKAHCEKNNVEVFSSNFALYGDISSRIMQALSGFAEEMEIYSIDEAFLHFSGEGFKEYAQTIRRALKKWVGIPTSLGIAPTKTLAKVAGHLAKRSKEGVFSLHEKDLQDRVLGTVQARDVWGVGYQSEKLLKTLGIYTAGQLRDKDPLIIRKAMGVMGERLQLELKGIDCSSYEELTASKSITCSRSFGKRVTDLEELEEALSTYAVSAAQKLRGQGSLVRAATVFIEVIVDAKLWIRSVESRTIVFDLPTSSTPEIIAKAKGALRALYQLNTLYKKCGLVLFDLIDERKSSPDLFLRSTSPKERELSKTVDAINQKFGKKSLFYAAMGTKESWKMRSDNCSQNYTGNWSELPIVS